jgi:hypothetical protein
MRGVAATLLIHLVLLYALLHDAPTARHTSGAADARRMLWLRLTPRTTTAATAFPAPPPIPHARPQAASAAAATSPRRADRAATGASDHAAAAPATRDTPAAPSSELAAPVASILPDPAPATPSVDDMLRIAKRDVGKIDRELRQQFPDRAVKPEDSPRKRLEKVFAEAYAAAPPKWYEGARIVEVTDPESNGVRIYRVQTAFGAYCMFYPAKNSLIDQGSVTSGRPSLGICP